MNVPPLGTGPVNPPHHLPFKEKQKLVGRVVKKQIESTKNVAEETINPNAKKEESSTSPRFVSKEKIEELSQSPEAVKVKQSFSWNPLSLIGKFFSWLKTGWQNLIHFKFTSKSKAENTGIVNIEKVPAEISQLREAAHQIAQHLRQNHQAAFQYEGVFRQSGRENEKKRLYNEITQSPDETILPELTNGGNAILVAALFKEVYRDMNLFGSTENLQREFDKTAEELTQLNKETQQPQIIEKLQALIDQLSPEQKEDLGIYLEILLLVNKQESTNKMSLSNLAIVAGPNLNTTSSNAPVEEQFRRAPIVNNLGLLLLTHFNSLKFKPAGQE